MIHQIMIITDVGICIFNHEFTKAKIDSILFGGFCSALNTFSQELSEKMQNIESINMSGLKMIMSAFKRFNLVLIINKYDEIHALHGVIVDLQNNFLEMYGHLEESDWDLISNFAPFDPVAVSICRTHIDIGIISPQSQLKMEFWNNLNALHNRQNTSISTKQNWNTLQISCDSIENCDISVWNIDLNHNSEALHLSLKEKSIIFILIEPNIKKILDFVPLVHELKSLSPNKEIYGIIIKKYGKILRSNCEILLKIPIFELNINSEADIGAIKKLLSEVVLGNAI